MHCNEYIYKIEIKQVKDLEELVQLFLDFDYPVPGDIQDKVKCILGRPFKYESTFNIKYRADGSRPELDAMLILKYGDKLSRQPVDEPVGS